MNFCSKCGSKLEPNTSFCSNCGNAVTNTNITDTNNPKKKKLSNKLIGLIACILVVTIIVTVSICIDVTYESPEDVVFKYLDAYSKLDLETMSKYTVVDLEEYYNGYIDYVCYVEDCTPGEVLKTAQDEINDELDYNGSSESVRIYNIEDIFEAYTTLGEYYINENDKNYLEITDYEKTKLNSNEMNERIEEFERWYFDELKIEDYIDCEKVKKGYDITFDDISYSTLNGVTTENTYESTLTVVKYKGKWKVLHLIEGRFLYLYV